MNRLTFVLGATCGSLLTNALWLPSSANRDWLVFACGLVFLAVLSGEKEEKK